MSGIDGDVEPGQLGEELLQQRQRSDAAVGDEQRTRHALLGQMLGDELARAGRRSESWSEKRIAMPVAQWSRDARRQVPSDDLEIALQFPIGHAVQPLPPFPFAGGGEVVDEVVAEPVARDVGSLEDARRLDQRARRARNVLGALVGAV